MEITGCTSGLAGTGAFESYGNNVIRSNITDFDLGAVLTPVALQ